jgi:hypothetical protein
MSIDRGTDLQILISGLAFPESPRWHDGRLWVSDWVRTRCSRSTSMAAARSLRADLRRRPPGRRFSRLEGSDSQM